MTERADHISRRAFVEASALAGVFVTTSSTPRRAGDTTPTPARPAIPPFELEEATIAQLQDGMKTGKYTSRSITQLYLGRIDALDQRGPAVNHVLEVNPDALAIADALDQERKAKGPRSPLHGIPVLIKDNIDTADRMHTTAGSLAVLDAKPLRDSFVA